MDYKEIFAKRLKEQRKAKGKTQKDMSIALDITRESYLAYEHGIAMPKFENLMKIHEELEVSIDYLVGISDKKNTEKIKIEQQNNNYGSGTQINYKK